MDCVRTRVAVVTYPDPILNIVMRVAEWIRALQLAARRNAVPPAALTSGCVDAMTSMGYDPFTNSMAKRCCLSPDVQSVDTNPLDAAPPSDTAAPATTVVEQVWWRRRRRRWRRRWWRRRRRWRW